MRIKPGDHAADGFLDQLLVVDRLDVKGFDRAEDIAELPQVFERQGRARIALGHGRDAETDQDAGDRTGGHESERLELVGHRSLLMA